MIGDRDRRILAETERQLRNDDPDLARSFELGAPAGTRWRLLGRAAQVATSIPMMTILLLLLIMSMVLVSRKRCSLTGPAVVE